MRRHIAACVTFCAIFVSTLSAQTDPEGAQDSFYVDCAEILQGDTLAFRIRFFSDNTGHNRIEAFGLPLMFSIQDSFLLELDTSLQRTFAGSMISHFSVKSTGTTSCCGGNANPTISPVHVTLGAVNFEGGVTGDSLFATLRFRLRDYYHFIDMCIDTASTDYMQPMVVTEDAQYFTPGWHFSQLACYYYRNFCPTNSVREQNLGNSGLPEGFFLNQNIPNPFNNSTEIRFSVFRACSVKLDIFDIMGRKVRTLVDENLTAGYKQVVWDGKNENGDKVASGIYFYRIKAADYLTTKKMMLLK